MLVKRKQKGYSSQRICVHGAGFTDALQTVKSFLYQNKDIIAKPLLGAAAEIGAKALTEGGKALINRIVNKKSKIELEPKSQDILHSIVNRKLDPPVISPKGQEILQSILTPAVGNIIGSGCCSGVKRF